MNQTDDDEIFTKAPRRPVAFDDAVVEGPVEVSSVEEGDEILESVRCECGSDATEEVAVKKTRTKRRPRKHFERHFFRCPTCSAEKVLLLDVTTRRRLLGI